MIELPKCDTTIEALYAQCNGAQTKNRPIEKPQNTQPPTLPPSIAPHTLRIARLRYRKQP